MRYCSQTNNGRFKILDEPLVETSDNETEIGPSVNSNLEYPDNIEYYNSIGEPSEDKDNNEVVKIKRDPGRLRKVKKHRKSRPN